MALLAPPGPRWSVSCLLDYLKTGCIIPMIIRIPHAEAKNCAWSALPYLGSRSAGPLTRAAMDSQSSNPSRSFRRDESTSLADETPTAMTGNRTPRSTALALLTYDMLTVVNAKH